MNTLARERLAAHATGESVAAGETWQAQVEGLGLPSLMLRFEA